MERSSKTPSKPLQRDDRVEPAGPTHWVHGEHPERARPKRGEEPPRNVEPNRGPDRIER
jgi:hypothetical protein